ncbi:MAG: carboxypeptidase-like regulatory domain-containing protein [Bacteroidetes bacterium]|nr:carboxypeptidase-like regulatory domain-containing protein [Bacteroidota bacterium]
MIHIITGLLLFASTGLSAQQTAVIYGRIADEDQKSVANANISIIGSPGGTTSDKTGHFEIRVPAGKKITLSFSYIGFETENVDDSLAPGERKEMVQSLKRTATSLPSIEVKDQQLRTNTFNRIDTKAIMLIPSANAGIEDLIKTMPGVVSRNELSSQYSVRGGNYDENLVFVNDIEIYRPFLVRSGQQEGLSFLNPDLVSSIAFSAGGFDAKYGDKMSSVLDIKYKRPTEFAGSFELSLLGANAHLEGLIGKKFSYLAGVRYKSNSYFLKGLDTKGDYKPKYFDVQTLFNYEINKKWELSLLGTYSNNYYQLIPQTQETNFGTLGEAYKLTIYFDGQEVDKYQNWLGALTASWKPTPELRLKLTASAYQTFEQETYDISAEYWLAKLEVNQNSGGVGQVTEALGVGSYLDHARNYLNGTVFDIEHRGTNEKGISLTQWGVKYQHEFFHYVVNEWELLDSAGYSLPRPPDSLGSPNPQHDSLVLADFIKNKSQETSNRFSAFLQNTWTFRNEKNDISLTAGLRSMYWDYNGQFLLDPRVNLSFKPHWKREVVFRISGGYYSQPPTFREITDLRGNMVSDLKAQRALQAVVGSDLYFKGWGRPFKFVAEAYYKYITDLIPYTIDNLKIRYYGTNDAFGYATGIDFRVNGEFVKGVESWASLSFMKTQENINGDWIPRPTDQRVNLSIFFQDYIPHYPTWRMNLTLFYGTGLPFGPPNSPKNQQTLRMPPYRRVDIGLAKQIIGENTKFSKKNPFRVFHSMWISLEVFNLLQISNTVSYLWVTDVNSKQYAVPNYLTPRQFNIKLQATF